MLPLCIQIERDEADWALASFSYKYDRGKVALRPHSCVMCYLYHVQGSVVSSLQLLPALLLVDTISPGDNKVLESQKPVLP